MFIDPNEDIFHNIVILVYVFFATLGYFILKIITATVKILSPKTGNFVAEVIKKWVHDVVSEIVDIRLEQKLDEKLKPILIKQKKMDDENANELIIEMIKGIYRKMGKEEDAQKIIERSHERTDD